MKKSIKKITALIFGALLYAIGVNLFIVSTVYIAGALWVLGKLLEQF